MVIEVTLVQDGVGSGVIQADLFGDVNNPWFNFLPVTPSIAPVQPRAMLVRHNAQWDIHRTAEGCTCVTERYRAVEFIVDGEDMLRYTKFPTTIVV